MFLKRILYYLDPRTLFGRSQANVNLRFMRHQPDRHPAVPGLPGGDAGPRPFR